LLTPDFVKLSHNGASDAQASVYLWVGVAIGIYEQAPTVKNIFKDTKYKDIFMDRFTSTYNYWL